MAKKSRSSLNAVDQSWQKFKNCDICGNRICVNNYDDRKSRTPMILGFIVCGKCDPRIVWDRRMKQGYRIVHKDRMRIIRFAQVTRALAKFGCLDALGKEGPCKCAGCTAQRLLPYSPPADQLQNKENASRKVMSGAR